MSQVDDSINLYLKRKSLTVKWSILDLGIASEMQWWACFNCGYIVTQVVLCSFFGRVSLLSPTLPYFLAKA